MIAGWARHGSATATTQSSRHQAKILFGYLGLVISNFPYLVPPSLAVRETAAAPESRIFMLPARWCCCRSSWSASRSSNGSSAAMSPRARAITGPRACRAALAFNGWPSSDPGLRAYQRGITLDSARQASLQTMLSSKRSMVASLQDVLTLAGSRSLRTRRKNWRIDLIFQRRTPHGAIGNKLPIILLNRDGAASPPFRPGRKF